MKTFWKYFCIVSTFCFVSLYFCSWNVSSKILDTFQKSKGSVFASGHYEPNWESLDSRPLPAWYDKAKIGIFIHWGVFSVPSFRSEWFWKYWHDLNADCVEFMGNNYPPGFTYQDFASRFTAEFYDPEAWARLFSKAGAKYVVLTSKHHEGYTLWPSKYSFSWNAKDVGPHRDLLGDLAAAVKNLEKPLHFGLYHSLYEWFNPLYLSDKRSGFTEKKFVDGKTIPELYELVNDYHPEVIWSDGDWEAVDTYWGSTEFLAWLFNESPVKETVVVNDRWGIGTACNHGSFYNCQDRYSPGVVQKHKWENCMTLDKKSWGYVRKSSVSDYLTIEELLKTMTETVSCGGNLLVNVGPTHDGMIIPIMEERLLQMGTWLGINGEAIYESVPWSHQNDTYTKGVWYTQNTDRNYVYAIVLAWPEYGSVILGSVASADTSVGMLGYNGRLKAKQIPKGLEVSFPPLSTVSSKWAWVLVLKGTKPAAVKTP